MYIFTNEFRCKWSHASITKQIRILISTFFFLKYNISVGPKGNLKVIGSIMSENYRIDRK